MKNNIKKYFFSIKYFIVYLIISTSFISCFDIPYNTNIKRELFGKFEGQEIYLYTLTNKNGLTAKITNYGGIVTSILIPDKNGKFEDIVLGFDNIEDYLKGHPHFGCIVGRYANRIAKAKFTVNNIEYKLNANDGENILHGGNKGFHTVIWDSEEIKNKNEKGLKLTYLSKNGEEGFPGDLYVTVIYTLTNNNELKINYEANIDKPCPVNLTHHSYFNLAGAGKTDILNHEIKINANKYTVVNEKFIPTGELKDVKETDMEFTSYRKIGERINNINSEYFYSGYDHNYILSKKDKKLSLAAQVYESVSGRKMEVYTTEPCIQFYTGNFLDGSIVGKNNYVYKKHFGFCIEAQHYPDSPNHSEFPSTILYPGKKYKQTTIYKFLIKK